MRILLTGHSGLLGADLQPALQTRHEVHGCSLPHRDITNPEHARHAVAEARPDLVIHAAAYTAVDDCEKQPDLAFRVNALGTRNMVLAAREAGAAFCYLSTDYVFDGRKGKPYIEYDATNPLGVYGLSKWGGEQHVRYLSDRFYIVRAAWLFGPGGPCFPATILRLLREQGSVAVVTDQIGNPTYAPDLAEAIGRIVESGLYGTYHAVNSGSTSWFEFARAVAAAFDFDPEAILPTTSDRFIRPAPRPANSSLRNFVLEESLGHRMRPWSETLADYVRAQARTLEESA